MPSNEAIVAKPPPQVIREAVGSSTETRRPVYRLPAPRAARVLHAGSFARCGWQELTEMS